MDWGEAFSRATGAVLAAIIWSVVAIVLFWIGFALMDSGYGAFESVWGKVILGLLFVLAGWVLIYLGLLATAIKTITDAVTDHVEERSCS